jgi:hypothetical protein
MDHFYVSLTPRGRLKDWGKFNPDDPKLETVVLRTDFAKWAAQQSGFQQLEDACDFWVGPARALANAAAICRLIGAAHEDWKGNSTGATWESVLAQYQPRIEQLRIAATISAS